MEIGVLGPVVVLHDGAPAPLRSGLQRLLLAVLTAAGGQVVSPDALAQALWADDQPADPAAALQSQVSRLRRALGPAAAWLETAGAGGYRLVGGPDRVDAARFDALVAAASAPGLPPGEALRDVEAALAAWRGAAYAEVADHDGVRLAAGALEERRADAEELRAELLLAVDRPGEAARAMGELTARQPFRERPVAVRMRALALDGRHAEALAAYDEFRRRLADELGLDPSPELRALHAEVLDPVAVPAAGPAVALPGDSFVGRDGDLAAVLDALSRSRLVTLTGPGGTGKTRLALHAAAAAAGRFGDGVRICELAAVADPAAVPAALATTLGIRERAGQAVVARVAEFLRPQRVLLVLDNCEHVLVAAAGLVADVLAQAPGVVVLATSRARLGLPAERRLPLDALPTGEGDDPSAPAVVLFADRAAAVRPDFALTEANLAAVCELCRRLDGLPLALELAAARAVSRSPAEILAELAGRLDRLADRRRLVDRHRSIEAVVSWSYELLGPAERGTLERLSVFAGGFGAEAAAEVCGDRESGGEDLVDHIASLVENSLLRARDDRGRTRYAMLEPVRQFAEGWLAGHGLLEATRARHAAWCLRTLEEADAGLAGPDEARFARELDAELDNLRAAFRWAVEHDGDVAVRLAAASYRFAYGHGSAELFASAQRVVDRYGGSGHPALPMAYGTAAVGAWRRGDLAGSRALAERGIGLAPAGDPVLRFAWDALGDAAVFAGDLAYAAECWDRARALHRAAGDLSGTALTSAGLALTRAYGGDAAGARAAAAEVARLAAESRNPSARAIADYVAGEIRLDDAPAEALAFLRRAVLTARQVGNRFVVGVAGLSAVSCAARHGDAAARLGDYAELLEHWQREGEWPQQWATVRTLVETLTRLGRHGEAAVLHGALLASPTAPPLVGPDAERMAAAAAAAAAALGEASFALAQGEGAALGDDGAVAYALRCVRNP